ncbi:PD-(D/E)XK nuclease family protein [Candidatus Dojkabacteria bacterium]|nr:PD-(D/E)XK nuclease family protein [Candidatus Dojkabacteria bacterium]
MNEILKISAKNLGILALKDHCPRCFYLKLKMGFRIPYQIFPGIFSTIDSYSKKITWSHFAKHDKAPAWFGKIGKCRRVIPVPHHSKFYYIDEQLGFRLTGLPDEIVELEDGTYVIIDYKTSRYTNNQDHLLPIYKVQLNGYAHIFQKLGMGKVSGIYLLYYEPQGQAPVERDVDELIRQDGFVMPFTAHLKRLELNPEGIVNPLLKRVRKIWDKGQVPQANEGCKDCQMLEQMMKLRK